MHADVGVDAHRSLLHLGVGGADGHEDRPQLADVLAGLLGGADVGAADDLDQGHPGAVEVDQRRVAAVDPPATPADVRRFTRVLLEVGALDAHPAAVGQVEPAVDVEGDVVLADLVRLGHVGVEVVLAVEEAGLHRAVERETDPHRQLDGPTVEHRQRTRQAEGDRVDVGVRIVAEAVGAGREQLGGGRQLDVHLEPDHQLPPFPVRRRPARPSRLTSTPRGAPARSSSAATWNITGSASAGAITCTPTGRPSAPVPNGMLIAGSPERSAGIV